MKIDYSPKHNISYKCNICGQANIQPAGEFHREIPNCRRCGSTPRFRGIVYALSLALMGQSLPLKHFKADPLLRGIGMSEWNGYASILSRKYNFTNTFFHQKPYLDIGSEKDWQNYQNCDFLICTEVFEHVLQPLETGFRNLRRMLKKGGHLIFSTPFWDAPNTIEHYPSMVDFTTCQIGNEWLVVSKTADGGYQVYDKHVVFHGGPGTVLEMRMFGRDELVQQLETAGFSVMVLDAAAPEIGYYWPSVVDRQDFGYVGEHFILLCTAI